VAVLEPPNEDKATKAIHTTSTARELVKEGEVAINTVTTKKKHGGHQVVADGPIECLTYRDPFSFVYKK
jgi:nitrite reductase (NAD(P)H)